MGWRLYEPNKDTECDLYFVHALLVLLVCYYKGKGHPALGADQIEAIPTAYRRPLAHDLLIFT